MSLLDDFSYTERDGVPVVWAPGPAPLSAALVFRVGRSDEPFVDGGITHLVEHLVMRAVGRLPIEVNAHVGVHTTSFVATGTSSHVVDFLARVCASLDTLDAGALEVERRILTAESANAGGGPAAEAVSLRYGCRGAGLVAYRDVGVSRLSAAEVRSWSERWFTRENAVLALTGPVPDDLRLPLPPGERMPLSPLAPRSLDLPAWEPDCGGTAISLPVPSRAGMDLAVGRLLARAAEDVVRYEHGLAYDVDDDGITVDAGTSEVTVYADNEPEHATRVAGLLLDVLDRFAEAGPGDVALAADLAEAYEVLSDPRTVVDAVTAAAEDLLMGVQPLTPAQRYDLARARTAADVREAVRAAAPQVLLLLPGDEEPQRRGLRRLRWSSRRVPTGRELRPRLFRGAPRSARLVVGDAGLALRLPDGDLVALWEDVVGVTVLADGTHVVQTADGPALPVVPGDFRGAARAVEELRRRVPTGLFVRDPGEDAAAEAG